VTRLPANVEDVNAKGGLYQTPLHASATGGHFDVFSLLIDHFLAELHCAASGSLAGQLEIVPRLLSRVVTRKEIRLHLCA
jgi:hypothetical protein